MFAVLWAAGPAWADPSTLSNVETVADRTSMSGVSDTTFGGRHGCDHVHRSGVAYKRIRALVRHTGPAVDKQRVGHYATCLETRAKAHHAHELARAYWHWRHEYAQLWTIRLNRLPAGWVQWGRNITACESTWNRYASNGTHFSYYQWSMPTWYAAGGTGHPFDASWPHQTVLAVRWAWSAGTSQWVCQG